VIFGISGAPVPDTFPFAAIFNAERTVPPLLVASIAWRETLCTMSANDAQVCVSGDGGHGIMQLTASFPYDWTQPEMNIGYAVDTFLEPALQHWHGLYQEVGDRLVKLVAATYNEGLGAAVKYHAQGDVDLGTTNDYGAGVLAIYTSLRDNRTP
jgi:hypothetical protein